MKQNNTYNLRFKRRREGRTFHKKRLRILLSNKPRFVIRKSLRGIQISIIEYAEKGDRVLFTINSNVLGKLGWAADKGNVPSSYLTGLLAGKKALEKGINEATLDIGHSKSTKGSRMYAALAGAIDSGLKIPHDASILPSKDRISGEHMAKYAQMLKENKQKYERYFSNYLKKGMNPHDIVKHFNEIKGKIDG